jgi:hypothetical protein
LSASELSQIYFLAEEYNITGALVVLRATEMQRRYYYLDIGELAAEVGCDESTVRRAINHVNQGGPGALRGMGRPRKALR